jgi:hypothetical protein
MGGVNEMHIKKDADWLFRGEPIKMNEESLRIEEIMSIIIYGSEQFALFQFLFSV